MKQEKIDMEKLSSILKKYKGEKWSLIPLLQEVQEEYGYVPHETIQPIAKALHLFPSEVQGVITFYDQFYLTPRGRNVVRVCRGTACHVRGGKTVLRLMKQHLSLDEGETSEDLKFTLETVACLGACALSPVTMINKNYFGKMNPKKVGTVIKQCK
jgi:NADH:ubiquinone oxidoreductase subunit E